MRCMRSSRSKRYATSTATRREARTERQRLDDEGCRDDLVGPRRDPPAGALDVRRVEVRERVRGEQAIALEEAADARGRHLLFDMDLG